MFVFFFLGQLVSQDLQRLSHADELTCGELA